METLRKRDKGAEVQRLQLMLKALGLEPGDVDGLFGQHTEEAVRDFQDDFDQLEVDGIVGPLTWNALEQAHWMGDPAAVPTPLAAAGPLSCSDETWQQFNELVALVTKPSDPVVYGPGRGLWHDNQFVITFGPGQLGKTDWRSQTGKAGPSFHCSSWTNFVMGVLARRNEDYTHAGNIPALRKLCEAPNVPVKEAGVGTWRGYADICQPFESDGSTRKRTKIAGKAIVDLRELWERRMELPTFFVCGQSSKQDGKWKWWHHTVLFVIDHRQPGSPLYRIAADGFKSKSGLWSARPMKYTQVTEDDVDHSLGKLIFRGCSLHLPEKFDRPIAPVVLEV